MKTLKVLVDEGTFQSYSLTSKAIDFSELEEKVLLKHKSEIIVLTDVQKGAIRQAQEQVKLGHTKTTEEVFSKIDAWLSPAL